MSFESRISILSPDSQIACVCIYIYTHVYIYLYLLPYNSYCTCPYGPSGPHGFEQPAFLRCRPKLRRKFWYRRLRNWECWLLDICSGYGSLGLRWVPLLPPLYSPFQGSLLIKLSCGSLGIIRCSSFACLLPF